MPNLCLRALRAFGRTLLTLLSSPLKWLEDLKIRVPEISINFLKLPTHIMFSNIMGVAEEKALIRNLDTYSPQGDLTIANATSP